MYTYTYTYAYIHTTHIYIYIYKCVHALTDAGSTSTPSPPTKSLGFRGFDSSKLLKGWEFSCPYNFIGSLPESSTQELLVGKLSVGGLGVISYTMLLTITIER